MPPARGAHRPQLGQDAVEAGLRHLRVESVKHEVGLLDGVAKARFVDLLVRPSGERRC